MYIFKDFFNDVKYAFKVSKAYWNSKRIRIRRWKINHGWYNFKVKTIK